MVMFPFLYGFVNIYIDFKSYIALLDQETKK